MSAWFVGTIDYSPPHAPPKKKEKEKNASVIVAQAIASVLNFQRFYRHLELKSRHPDAAVPPLDETLKKITEPDSELISQSKPVIDEFRRQFELKENPKVIFFI